ncbi:uncharacterized protein LOC143066273 [Mytilus galloprovincialis]|uniref:uncharacterized protein LOC143066273 n=1 Tax=Mytilus galloprovincialis TaxID=29158 RepID=UPI003F7C1C4E
MPESENIDECQSNPCYNNATCTDRTPGWNCTCLPGFTGNQCQTDIDECQSDPCSNNATCIYRTPGWDCACVPGYTGNMCQTEIDECQSNPCYNNVTCIDKTPGYTYPYLGVIFKYNGTFIETKQKLVEQAEKAMFCVYKLIRNESIPVD